MFGLILIGCWMVLLIAAAVIIGRYRRHHLRTLDEQAQELGFSFDDNGSPFEGSEVRGLSVLRCDPSAIVSRMMTGKIGNSPAVIFNLICYGQHCQSVNAVTIAAFRSPAGTTPTVPDWRERRAARSEDAHRRPGRERRNGMCVRQTLCAAVRGERQS